MLAESAETAQKLKILVKTTELMQEEHLKARDEFKKNLQQMSEVQKTTAEHRDDLLVEKEALLNEI